jgi:putative toxin-antitoxin system antitoxin component (TIGR02293 family)
MQTDTLLGTILPEQEPLKLLDRLTAGLPAATLRQFKRAARLADSEVAAMLQVSDRTLSRLKTARARLSGDLSDRLYAVASIYALADTVLGGADKVRVWLVEPQHGLGGKKPQELLGTELGRNQVRSLLKRIEHGFLA